MSIQKKATKGSVPGGGSANQADVPCEPAVEEIQARAYEIYIQRGQIDGFDIEDWLQAKEELKQSRNKPTD
jgi:hypothetical protein